MLTLTQSLQIITVMGKENCFIIIKALILGLLLVSCSPKVGCKLPRDTASDVSEIRGLEFKEDVPCQQISRGEMNQRLQEKFDMRNSSSELNNEEAVYKAVALIPGDYSYAESVAKVYRDSALAYYDREQKLLVFDKSLSKSAFRRLTAHELVHALQGQYYAIEDLLAEDLSSDAHLSRMALLEGDANLVMHYYLSGGKCRERNDSRLLSALAKSVKANEDKTAPLSMRMLSVFPYIFGQAFVCSMVDSGSSEMYGQAFNLEKAPNSTSEIMHSDRYFARLNSTEEATPSNRLFTESQYVDTLGEFLLFSILASYYPMSQAWDISSDWRNDIAVLELDTSSKGEGDVCFTWTTEWKDDGAAKRFVEKYQAILDESAQVRDELNPHSKCLNGKAELTDIGSTVILSYRY